MSRNTSVTKKPYCKVCFDAGKPESEYTSHWVRTLPDRSGKTTVTCPTLLNTECRYCNQSGHTIKFCKVLEKQNKAMDRAEKAELTAKQTKQVAPKQKQANKFALLCEDSDTEDDNIGNNDNDIKFPELNNVEVVVKQEVKTGWAAIVAKPAEVKVAEPAKRTGLVMLSDYIKTESKIEEKKQAPWSKKQPVVTKSWADESDSEEDDYDPYEPYTFAVAEEDDPTW